MPNVTAHLTAEELKTVLVIADRRGVDANSVLRQAIATEALIFRHVGRGDELLVRKPDHSLSRIVFG